ncbi:unnamed protein product [Rhodiola kirilowii]
MAYSKAFLCIGLLFAVALAITSEVSARDLAAQTQDVVDGNGGHGGNGGLGGEGGSGGMYHFWPSGGNSGPSRRGGGHLEDKTDEVVEGGHYGGGGRGGGHYGGGGGHGGHGGGGHGGHPENEN